MFDATAIPVLEQMTATSKPALQMLFGAALLLLLVATTNVSSLLLARAAARQQQFAIQLAIGAGRFRIARQLLAETTVLCLAGGVLGASRPSGPCARWSRSVPGRAAPRSGAAWTGRARVRARRVDGRGSCPGRDDDVRHARRGAGRRRCPRDRASGTGGRRGLLVRQIARRRAGGADAGAARRRRDCSPEASSKLLAVNPGFTLDDALVVDLTVTDGGTDFRAAAGATARHDLERLRQLPGVSQAGLITGFPLGGGNYANGQFIEMTSADEISDVQAFSKLGPDVIEAASGLCRLSARRAPTISGRWAFRWFAGRLIEPTRRTGIAARRRHQRVAGARRSGPDRIRSAASCSSATWTAISRDSGWSASSATCAS